MRHIILTVRHATGTLRTILMTDRHPGSLIIQAAYLATLTTPWQA